MARPKPGQITSGSIAGKYCDLGPVGFPTCAPSRRRKAVSLYDRLPASPTGRLDCHLVHTAIPALPRLTKHPRSFPRQPLRRSLASFAGTVSALRCHRGRGGFAQLSPAPASRQATLHPALPHTDGSRTGLQVNPKPWVLLDCMAHEFGPPCHQGQRPHAIADRPGGYPPAQTPDWASRARTRGFIDVPSTEF